VAHDDDLRGEVSITLVATGFNSPTRPMVWGTAKDDEIVNYLTDLRKSEEEMDTPSFLRRPTFGHRRDLPIPPATEKQADRGAAKPGAKTPVK
jgi:hypothetical protein